MFADGAARGVEADMSAVAELCLGSLSALDAYIVDTEERKKAVWSARGAFLEAIKASNRRDFRF